MNCRGIFTNTLKVLLFAVCVLVPIQIKAQSTVEMAASAREEEDRQETAEKSLASEIRKGLDDERKKLLDAIEAQIRVVQKNDADRVYLDHVDGTIRSLVSIGERQYILERHKNRLFRWLKNRKKPSRFKVSDLKKADETLNRTYRKYLENGLAQGQESNYSDFIKDYGVEYKTACVKAQRAWIQYRDAWAALLERTEPWKADKDIGVSIKTILTQERIEELTSDPINPD